MVVSESETKKKKNIAYVVGEALLRYEFGIIFASMSCIIENFVLVCTLCDSESVA